MGADASAAAVAAAQNDLGNEVVMGVDASAAQCILEQVAAATVAAMAMAMAMAMETDAVPPRNNLEQAVGVVEAVVMDVVAAAVQNKQERGEMVVVPMDGDVVVVVVVAVVKEEAEAEAQEAVAADASAAQSTQEASEALVLAAATEWASATAEAAVAARASWRRRWGA